MQIKVIVVVVFVVVVVVVISHPLLCRCRESFVALKPRSKFDFALLIGPWVFNWAGSQTMLHSDSPNVGQSGPITAFSPSIFNNFSWNISFNECKDPHFLSTCADDGDVV